MVIHENEWNRAWFFMKINETGHGSLWKWMKQGMVLHENEWNRAWFFMKMNETGHGSSWKWMKQGMVLPPQSRNLNQTNLCWRVWRAGCAPNMVGLKSGCNFKNIVFCTFYTHLPWPCASLCRQEICLWYLEKGVCVKFLLFVSCKKCNKYVGWVIL